MSDITLEEAVAQLDNYTANQIARLLTLAGKTGKRSSEVYCPVANYFYDVLGNRCVVDNHTVYIRDGGFAVDLPGGVKRFISKFDMGDYEDLADHGDDNGDDE